MTETIVVRDLLAITLLIIAALTGGFWLGSRVYRRQVHELLQIAKDLVELFSPKEQKENIEALVDFNVASLVWHMSAEDSVAEADALEISAKSLARMEKDVRELSMEGIMQARKILDKSRAVEKAKVKESNGAGAETEH